MWMSSSESSLGLLYSVVRSTERSCEAEFCYLGHRRKANDLCFLYEICHRVDRPINEYMKYFLQLVILRLQLL